MSISEIKKGVSSLSVKERAALAQWIITNLDQVSEEESVVNTAWRKQVRERVESIRAGKVKMIPAEEMWRYLLADYVKTN